jgi:hypothetical protein
MEVVKHIVSTPGIVNDGFVVTKDDNYLFIGNSDSNHVVYGKNTKKKKKKIKINKTYLNNKNIQYMI